MAPIPNVSSNAPKAQYRKINVSSRQPENTMATTILKKCVNYSKKNVTFAKTEKCNRMYRPIQIDRKNLTIMGVKFPDLATLDRTASAIGSNMFEGFEPTEKLIQLYLDYKTGKIGNNQLLVNLKAIL